MSNPSRLPRRPVAEVWDWQLNGSCRNVADSVFFVPDNATRRTRRQREVRPRPSAPAARYGPGAPPMRWPPANHTASGAASPKPNADAYSPLGGRISPTAASNASTSGG